MSAPCVLLSLARTLTQSCPAAGRLHSGLLTSVTRRMLSKRQMDHLERTATNSRQNALYPAEVCGIINESETVKRLRIAVHPDFTFKAGQWVDFFIPGVKTVGGFSMCSSPGLLQREGVVELAVKYTEHPPAYWVHTACVLGSQVALRVGGDFFFDPSPCDPSVDLLLVAGGVGINPLYSILQHTSDLLRMNDASGGRGYNIGSTHIFYSIKNTQELLFKSSIVEICKEFPDTFSCDFHITQQKTNVEPQLQPRSRRSRITAQQLQAHVDPQRTLCYLCGPPPMLEAVSKTLMDMGLSKDRIFFEKWW